MKVSLLFLAHNRLEFTRASLVTLLANTDWRLVDRVYCYDDCSTDGTRWFLETVQFPVPTFLTTDRAFGSPVAIMNDVITTIGSNAILAKIDNDTMVPNGWLNECLTVMEREPALDLLGIEAMHPVAAHCEVRNIAPATHIGGIGLMRTSAFTTLPKPNGLGGFTEWQWAHPEVAKAWLNQALPVCLLDRMPQEPWVSLSRDYIAKGWQRPWQMYDETDADLWRWFAA